MAATLDLKPSRSAENCCAPWLAELWLILSPRPITSSVNARSDGGKVADANAFLTIMICFVICHGDGAADAQGRPTHGAPADLR